MAGSPIPAMPLTSRVVDPPINKQDLTGGWTLARSWVQWLNTLAQAVQSTSPLLRTVSLSAQAASLAPTPVPSVTTVTGIYRLSYFTRITQAATTASSLTVTLGWVTGGQPCTVVGAALVANTVTTNQSGVVVVTADQATSFTYSTSYSSTGATPMQYALTVTVERVT